MDLKLGARMLVKYPGLTIIGGTAIAFGIAVGAAGFEGLTQIASPTLPLPSGHRIVAINHLDLDTVREKLSVVEQAGGFRTVERNLIAADGVPEPIAVAEISASAFDIAGRSPLFGRTLSASDEALGAPPVAVIGPPCFALQGIACMSCRDACPTGAVRFELALGGARPRIEAERCTGCGDCLRTCPADAIQWAVPEAVT